MAKTNYFLQGLQNTKNNKDIYLKYNPIHRLKTVFSLTEIKSLYMR